MPFLLVAIPLQHYEYITHSALVKELQVFPKVPSFIHFPEFYQYTLVLATKVPSLPFPSPVQVSTNLELNNSSTCAL
jgi:hypothetical protein